MVLSIKPLSLLWFDIFTPNQICFWVFWGCFAYDLSPWQAVIKIE